jgi:isopentenyl diphosphate isomerase/L-lactate dehydrogenase-like FMN-dependent dehydrogenase
MTQAVASPRVINIEDLRLAAKRRVPRAIFDYIEGGAEGEVTLRQNCTIFESVSLRPRAATAVSQCDLTTKIFGSNLALPFLLAPIGSSRMLHPRGEIDAAYAAGEAGTAYILSTMSGYSLEVVKAASSAPTFYQLYLVGGREVAESTIERAKKAGYSALFVTVDTPVSGMRERDLRNGIPALIGRNASMLPYLPQLFARPGWLWNYMRDGGLMKFPNIVIPGKGPLDLAHISKALENTVTTWDDLRWIRELWDGPLIIKGILTVEDACRAIDEGANGIVISNHGGRQLDCVSPTLRVLPEIVKAVGGQVEILMDGGIRRGSDIIKAICLGARAVLIGRAYTYGLAAAGAAGVTRAIEILRADLIRTMKLLGCKSIVDLSTRYVDVPHEWHTHFDSAGDGKPV